MRVSKFLEALPNSDLPVLYVGLWDTVHNISIWSKDAAQIILLANKEGEGEVMSASRLKSLLKYQFSSIADIYLNCYYFPWSNPLAKVELNSTLNAYQIYDRLEYQIYVPENERPKVLGRDSSGLRTSL